MTTRVELSVLDASVGPKPRDLKPGTAWTYSKYVPLQVWLRTSNGATLIGGDYMGNKPGFVVTDAGMESWRECDLVARELHISVMA